MAAVNAARLDFGFGERRLIDMVAAAFAAPDIDRLKSACSDAGFRQFQAEEFRTEGNALSGWRLEIGNPQ